MSGNAPELILKKINPELENYLQLTRDNVRWNPSFKGSSFSKKKLKKINVHFIFTNLFGPPKRFYERHKDLHETFFSYDKEERK